METWTTKPRNLAFAVIESKTYQLRNIRNIICVQNFNEIKVSRRSKLFYRIFVEKSSEVFNRSLLLNFFKKHINIFYATFCELFEKIGWQQLATQINLDWRNFKEP